MMRIAAVILIILLLSGCTAQGAEPAIRLSELRPLPAQPATALVPLRVSVAAVISPRGTAESYEPLLAYLSAKLNRPVELEQRRTYAETNDLVAQGRVDLAFVCTSAYIAGHDAFNMELLAAPQVGDAAVYHSLLVVPAKSSVRSMSDLRGAVFAFTDPMSYSGRVYPTALVQELGSTPEQFFARTFYTYNHDDAIRAVAEGLADGAAVDSLVYDFAIAREPQLAGDVRVIHRSSPFGIPPVVVNPNLRPQLKATLRDLLLGMADDPDGQRTLQSLGIQRFVPIDDRAYDSVRQLISSVGRLTP
jgi:phosphonate transport system substrate-binding protein